MRRDLSRRVFLVLLGAAPVRLAFGKAGPANDWISIGEQSIQLQYRSGGRGGMIGGKAGAGFDAVVWFRPAFRQGSRNFEVDLSNRRIKGTYSYSLAPGRLDMFNYGLAQNEVEFPQQMVSEVRLVLSNGKTVKLADQGKIWRVPVADSPTPVRLIFRWVGEKTGVDQELEFDLGLAPVGDATAFGMSPAATGAGALASGAGAMAAEYVASRSETGGVWHKITESLRIIGGLAEMGVGLALLLVPEPTFATKLLGVAVIGHGFDSVLHGSLSVAGGRHAPSLTAQLIGFIAQQAGLRPQTAETVGELGDAVVGIAGSLGAGLAARATRAAAEGVSAAESELARIASEAAVDLKPSWVPPGTFAREIEEARKFAGAIPGKYAGDCENASMKLSELMPQRVIQDYWGGKRASTGDQILHEFRVLLDEAGRPGDIILDPTAAQFFESYVGPISEEIIELLPGLEEAIKSGVFHRSLHNALLRILQAT